MAASASPSVGDPSHSNASNGNNNCGNNGGCAPEKSSGCDGLSAADNSVVRPTPSGMRHNIDISSDWSSEEQSTLEELLVKYSADIPAIRYARIALLLNDKTTRDVAMRCRWMNKKEIGKRRKDDNNNLPKKNKEKKEKVTDSVGRPASAIINRSNGPPYVQPMISMDADDGISFKAIGGVAGQLLQQCAESLDQISNNFNSGKVLENIQLFIQARDNIFSVMNDSNETPAVMKHMPPLPVKINEDLASSL
ncbi:hypothetical protein M569_02740, partial [Genlisea aurea]